MTIEKFEDLNRDLAAIGQVVTKFRCRERAALAMSYYSVDYGHHLVHGRPQEEMVMRHLVSPAHASGELE
jgi:hypothetical protein